MRRGHWGKSAALALIGCIVIDQSNCHADLHLLSPPAPIQTALHHVLTCSYNDDPTTFFSHTTDTYTQATDLHDYRQVGTPTAFPWFSVPAQLANLLPVSLICKLSWKHVDAARCVRHRGANSLPVHVARALTRTGSVHCHWSVHCPVSDLKLNTSKVSLLLEREEFCQFSRW